VLVVWAIAPDGRGELRFASRGVADLLGGVRAPSWRLASALRKLLAPEEYRRLLNGCRAAVGGERPVTMTLAIRHPERGARRIELIANHEVHLDGGRLFHGYLHDVTERYQSAAALEEIRQTHQDVFENSSECIFVLDRDGDGGFRVVAANPVGLTMFGGLLSGSPFGCRIDDVLGDTGVRLARRVERVLARRQVVDDEVSPEASGLSLWLNLRLVPIVDRLGRPERVIGFCRDITAERVAAAERFGREQQFNNLVVRSPDPVVRFDVDLRRIYGNNAYYELTGGTPETMLGVRPDESSPLDRDDARAYCDFLNRVLAGAEGDEYVLDYVTATGRNVICSVRAVREYNRAGEVIGVLTVLRDMSERILAERRLAQRERDFRQLVENSPDMISRHDLNGRRLYENPAFRERIGEPYRGWCSVATADLRRIDVAVRSVGRTGLPFATELEHRGRRGETWWSHYSVAPECDEDGRVVAVLCIGRDVTETVIYRERLRRAAYLDDLTGLPNRSRLTEEANTWISAGRTFALMMLDLDGFKEVNDGLGHDAGDVLLRVIAHRLLAVVGDDGLVCRLGGDEFALIVKDDDGTASQRLADRILAAIVEPAGIAGREIFVSASIGIARCPFDAGDVDQLLSHADAAMYKAKAAGRNHSRFYTADMSARAVERMLFAGSLRRADQRGEFLLHYQPQFDLADGRLTGVEGLLRWNHPELGLVMPDRFVPIAEETGLIVEIGRWVIAEACRAVVRWNRSRVHPIRVSVNLSARQFVLNDMVGTVRTLLAETGCEPSWLELEITESLLLGDENVVESLDAFSAMGVSIAIDDFGTGYSALGYLHRFPIHTLKIDRSFMTGVETDRKKSGIVRAIISIASALDMRLVAEGVETLQQVQVLDGYGCHAAQGYYFGRPVSEEVFVRDHLSRADYEPDNPWDCFLAS
jgi:diguanylate cyclase (GGDEF)-like protein/PAS domain S-box-containing protein